MSILNELDNPEEILLGVGEGSIESQVADLFHLVAKQQRVIREMAQALEETREGLHMNFVTRFHHAKTAEEASAIWDAYRTFLDHSNTESDYWLSFAAKPFAATASYPYDSAPDLEVLTFPDGSAMVWDFDNKEFDVQ